MEVRVSAAGGEEGPRSPPPQKWRAEEVCGRWRTAREEGQGGGRTDGGAAHANGGGAGRGAASDHANAEGGKGEGGAVRGMGSEALTQTPPNRRRFPPAASL